MALFINTGKTLYHDVTFNSLYLRLDVILDKSGTKVRIKPHLYSSKEAFKNDPLNNEMTNIKYIPEIMANYDSTVDGDFLTFAHDEYKKFLVEERTKTETVINQDGSTSQVTIVIKPSFATETSISIVDLD